MVLFSRVEVEESRHNRQNQTLHEDEETQRESSVVVRKRVGKRDVSSHQNPARNPYPLPFLVPHYFNIPDSQCIKLRAYCLLSLPGTFMPIGCLSLPEICADSIAASPWTTTRPLPNLNATA
jgi:hypothetical protein